MPLAHEKGYSKFILVSSNVSVLKLYAVSLAYLPSEPPNIIIFLPFSK